jgi:hypothetical protein
MLLNDPDAAIEAMIINGWDVVPTSKLNEGFVPDMFTQGEMFNDR